MKIKVIASKLDKEDNSYSSIEHMIGKIFEVIDEDDDSYYIELNQPSYVKWFEIRKDEGEVVE